MTFIATSYPSSYLTMTPDHAVSLLRHEKNNTLVSANDDAEADTSKSNSGNTNTATTATTTTIAMNSDHHLLPIGFVPSSYSVLFGRGKKCTDSIGNRRLKVVASLFLERYTNAKSREAKSEIVSEIQSTIQSAFGSTTHSAFVKPAQNGRWAAVEDSIVRGKISQALRDCLHTKYRSSVKNKVAKRRNRRMSSVSSASSSLPSSWSASDPEWLQSSRQQDKTSLPEAANSSCSPLTPLESLFAGDVVPKETILVEQRQQQHLSSSSSRDGSLAFDDLFCWSTPLRQHEQQTLFVSPDIFLLEPPSSLAW